MTRFYLGTHMPNWLADQRFADVPLFVSRTRLANRKTMPRAAGRWALDSGGFTQLHKHGRWTIGVDQYVDDVYRFSEIGGLDWVAPMDWMCEPGARKATGRSVAEHQALTVDNFLALRGWLGDLVIPVLQGWEPDEYTVCADLYWQAGVDLDAERVVGVGSVCRRNADADIRAVLTSLELTNLHGFGLRGEAVFQNRDVLASADSMAWSYDARKNQPMLGCQHARCGNCPRWALRWREEHIMCRLAQAVLPL